MEAQSIETSESEAREYSGAGLHEAAQLTPPPIPGQVWAGHGHYIGIMRSADGLTGWHLILPIGEEFYTQGKYGCYGQKIPGADCEFDGLANTEAMALAGSQIAKTALERGCYIPSKAESALLYAIAKGEFKTDDWHPTSTQYSKDGAWFQDFSYGSQYILDKDVERRVRFVRRLPLQSFNTLSVSV